MECPMRDERLFLLSRFREETINASTSEKEMNVHDDKNELATKLTINLPQRNQFRNIPTYTIKRATNVEMMICVE